MTACSFAVWAHVCWNWAVRAERTDIPLFILGHTLSTCRSLDMRRLGSIRRFCRAFVQRLAGWISKPSSQLEASGREDEPRTQHLRSLTARSELPTTRLLARHNFRFTGHSGPIRLSALVTHAVMRRQMR